MMIFKEAHTYPRNLKTALFRYKCNYTSCYILCRNCASAPSSENRRGQRGEHPQR